MELIWRIFLVFVTAIAVILGLACVYLGIAVWWSAVTFIAKCIFSGYALLIGLVFGLGMVSAAIQCW